MAPTLFVYAYNHDIHVTICAACSSFDIEYAIGHALTEVEAAVVSRLQSGHSKSISPREVSSPLGHLNLYGQKSYYDAARFLIVDGDVISMDRVGIKGIANWGRLLTFFRSNDLDLITIPLNVSNEYGGNANLYIYRCIIPGLTPMYFGYRNEPGGVKRIYDIARKFKGEEYKYKDIVKFPHPFG